MLNFYHRVVPTLMYEPKDAIYGYVYAYPKYSSLIAITFKYTTDFILSHHIKNLSIVTVITRFYHFATTHKNNQQPNQIIKSG